MEENNNPMYCIIDGYIQTVIGKVPNMIFEEGPKIALKYTALNLLLSDFENYLQDNIEKYEEILDKLNELKNEAFTYLKQYNVE